MRHRPLPTPARRQRPAGFSLAAAFVGSLLAVTVAHAFTLPGSVGLLLVMVVVALSSLDATWAATLGGAMLGWLFVTGFVINQFGELRIAGTGDAWRLLLLVGVAVTSAAARRWHVRTRTRTRVGWIVAASPAASAEPEAASRMFRGVAGR